jgi:anti-sigma factor RsiW
MRPLLELYVDGELDAVAGLELERHLQDCADCARARQQLLTLRQTLRAEVPRFPAPARLRDNIQIALRRSARPRFAVPPTVWPWLAAASLLLAVVGISVGWYGMWAMRSADNRLAQQDARAAEERLAQQVVFAHVRSLQPGHVPTDVASSNHHKVKPWFEGKTDYPPPVFDLEKEGFKLLGGRLDYFDNRAVAALVYQRGDHIINLFVWPDDGRTPAVGPQNQRGFHLVPLRHGGMTGWVISDTQLSTLQEFVRLFQEAMDQ